MCLNFYFLCWRADCWLDKDIFLSQWKLAGWLSSGSGLRLTHVYSAVYTVKTRDNIHNIIWRISWFSLVYYRMSVTILAWQGSRAIFWFNIDFTIDLVSAPQTTRDLTRHLRTTDPGALPPSHGCQLSPRVELGSLETRYQLLSALRSTSRKSEWVCC